MIDTSERTHSVQYRGRLYLNHEFRLGQRLHADQRTGWKGVSKDSSARIPNGRQMLGRIASNVNGQFRDVSRSGTCRRQRPTNVQKGLLGLVGKVGIRGDLTAAIHRDLAGDEDQPITSRQDHLAVRLGLEEPLRIQSLKRHTNPILRTPMP